MRTPVCTRSTDRGAVRFVRLVTMVPRYHNRTADATLDGDVASGDLTLNVASGDLTLYNWKAYESLANSCRPDFSRRSNSERVRSSPDPANRTVCQLSL